MKEKYSPDCSVLLCPPLCHCVQRTMWCGAHCGGSGTCADCRDGDAAAAVPRPGFWKDTGQGDLPKKSMKLLHPSDLAWSGGKTSPHMKSSVCVPVRACAFWYFLYTCADSKS